MNEVREQVLPVGDEPLSACPLRAQFLHGGWLDGLGPFLGVFLQKQSWSPAEIGMVMTIGGLAGMVATTPAGALIDKTTAKGRSS